MATKRSIAPVHSAKSKKRRKQSKTSTYLADTKAHDVAQTSQRALATSKAKATNSDSTPAMEVTTRVAILVPFRDNHPIQRRRAHLNEFVHYMSDYLYRNCAAKGASFHIFILEQSLDGRKFNRGKLLNAGFDMARNDYDIYIFHDVDLLPGEELSEHYTTVPHAGPMHIARVWKRYNESPTYFGGIVAFTRQHFIKVNGFPNNFWGWGGEDNELYSRVVRKKLIVHAPTSGTVRDLEEMNLEEKLTLLRSSKWKCSVKHELLKEHHRTWKKNGLKSLHYEYLDADTINEHCTKITIKLGPNGHWSDSRSSWEYPSARDEESLT